MSSYALEIVQTPITVPSILGDFRPIDDPSYLYSVYSGTAFLIYLKFTLKKIDGEVTETVAIDSIDVDLPTSVSGLYSTVIDPNPVEYVISVGGTVSGGLIGTDSYKFVLDEEGFPVVTTTPQQIPNDFLALVEWLTPTVTYALLSGYNFTAIGVDPNDTASYSMLQYVYWDWVPALNLFEQVVTQGDI